MATADQIATGLKTAAQMIRSGEAIQRAVLLAERGVKQVTPVRTGHLRRSITSRVESNTLGRVGTNLRYARAVHQGRRAVTIRPKNKRALFWKGAAHPVKGVHQKARAGNPFLTNGLNRAQPQIEADLAKFGIKVFGAVK